MVRSFYVSVWMYYKNKTLSCTALIFEKEIKMSDFKKTAPYAPNNQASIEAAEQIQHKLTGIRAKVFDFIVSKGEYGATGSEISSELEILPYTAKPRCTELYDAGYILNSGKMRKNHNDRNETVWVASKNIPQGKFYKTLRNKSKTDNNGFKLFAHEEPGKGTKFIATFNDGSGACLFMRLDGGDYINSDGDYCHEDIFDSYLYWAELPLSFKLWFEISGE